MLKSASLWISAIIILATNSAANAYPIFLDKLNITDIISQNTNEIPPDIVIDGDDSTPPPPTTTTNNGDVRFVCQLDNGQYTVMYNPESRPNEFYPWAIPSRMGGGWTPERRCNTISNRLESYRPDGLLELRTGVENGYDTLCVTTVDVPDCRIVLTVPIGQNPEVVRDRVFDNLVTADNGQQVEGINTYTNNGSIDLGSLTGILNPNKPSTGINLQQFLDPADGGTGEQLNTNIIKKNNNNRVKPSSSPKPESSKTGQFNPDSFR